MCQISPAARLGTRGVGRALALALRSVREHQVLVGLEPPRLYKESCVHAHPMCWADSH